VFSTRRAPPLEEREWEACRRTRSKGIENVVGSEVDMVGTGAMRSSPDE
jgi:hypothetical protein